MCVCVCFDAGLRAELGERWFFKMYLPGSGRSRTTLALKTGKLGFAMTRNSVALRRGLDDGAVRQRRMNEREANE